jgi:hypothetical protein
MYTTVAVGGYLDRVDKGAQGIRQKYARFGNRGVIYSHSPVSVYR